MNEYMLYFAIVLLPYGAIDMLKTNELIQLVTVLPMKA